MVPDRAIVREVLQKIYTSNIALAVPETQIARIEQFYKTRRNLFSSVEQMLSSDKDIAASLALIPAALAEITKQFAAGKGLQSSILTECNYAQTLARIFRLRSFADLDHTPVTKLPNQIAYALKQGEVNFSNARYVYYSKAEPDTFLVQYGNPADGDADLVTRGQVLALEFKKSGGAKAGEYDLKMDENGKIALNDETWALYPVLQKVVDDFNAETDIFSARGRNFRFDDNSKVTENVVANYFNKTKIDLLVTADKDLLCVIAADDITGVLPDGRPIMSTKGSEIRTTGRNPKKITPALSARLRRIIEPDILRLDGDICHLDLSDGQKYEIASGRGNAEKKSLKIESIFVVKQKFTVKGTVAVFDLRDVKVTAPTISVHIRHNASAGEMRAFYGL